MSNLDIVIINCARLMLMHEVITIIAKYGILVPVFTYLALLFRKRHTAKELILFTFLSAIITIVFVKVAATLHNDPRPFIQDGVKPYFSSATDNGFPSDHTVFSAVIAFIVLKYDKRLGLILFLTAVLIGAARVIGGVHHTQDVVAGLIIAGISVWLANVLTKNLWARLSDKSS